VQKVKTVATRVAAVVDDLEDVDLGGQTWSCGLSQKPVHMPRPAGAFMRPSM